MAPYDNAFNANEWSVIIGLSIGLLLVIFLPKRFPRKASFVFFICGVYTGFFFDNTLTMAPFDFYEVNDSSDYQVMDYLLYWAYGPMSYLFFYGLDYMGLKSGAVSFYIFSVVLIALGLEWVGTLLGVYHYLNGYKLSYSMPIYFTVFSLWVMLYRYYRILAANGKL
jgi:hypothetical protein